MTPSTRIVDLACRIWPSLLFTLIFGLTILAYRLSPVMLAACVILLAALRGRQWIGDISAPHSGNTKSRFLSLSAWRWAGLTMIFVFLACTWAPAPVSAAFKAGALFGAGAAVWLVWRLAAHIPAKQLHGAFLAAALAGCAALTVAIIDLSTGMSVTRFIVTLGADPNAFLIHPERWNRNMTLAALAYFPMLYAILGNPRAWKNRQALMVAASFAILALAAVFLSWKGAAKLALMAGAGAFFFTFLSRRLGFIIAITAGTLPLLLVVPAAQLADKANLEQAYALPETGRARIAIWAGYADEIKSEPGSLMFGRGVNATRTSPRIETDYRFLTPEEAKKWRVQSHESYRPVHAHNLPLQLWYEFGAVGVLLFCATGLALIAGFRSLDRISFAFAIATLVTSVCTLNLTHQLWQEWYLCVIGLSLAFFFMARGKHDEDSQTTAGISL